MVDGGETVFAESPMAKPANHDPSASIASPDPDPDSDPDPEFILLPNISAPEAPEYPIPYSDSDPDPIPDSDPNPC